MLTRRTDWESRLVGYLTENQARPFRYGDWDCALFVCGAINAMTGVDPAAWFRGRYGTRREAMKAMRERCGTTKFSTFFERMADELEMQDVSMRFASRGDVVLLKQNNRFLLGLMALNGMQIITTGDTGIGQGMGFVSLSSGVRAWRV